MPVIGSTRQKRTTDDLGRDLIERLTAAMADRPVGGKAASLAWLLGAGFRVPESWVVGPGEDLDAAVLDPSTSYAVRSSASVEDSAAASYAGQFTTRLDVPYQDLDSAVGAVRQSVAAERVADYRRRLGDTDTVAMTVLIQPMVPAVASGVAFSRNPMTGLNEVVVEAVEGRGDRLVDEGITPDRWIHRWGSWTQQPGDAVVSDTVAKLIVEGTRQIAGSYGRAVDLEWVWDGSELWWVQLRPITGLDDVGVYSNRISREVMPGMIKPLVWSVNVPMVNQAWVDLFTEVIGPNDIRPESLARAFAYRAYFNMGAIGDIFELLGMPRDSLELLLGLPAGDDQPSFKPTPATMRRMPRLMAVAARKSRYGSTVQGELRALRGAYRPFERAELSERSDAALLTDVAALSALGVRAAYANIVTPLLANLHNGVLRRMLSRAGLDPEAIDVADTGDLADVNPNPHLDALSERFGRLDDETVAAIRAGGYDSLPEGARGGVDEFLDRFGHLSASGNDFSVAPWRETPDAVVSMILDHAATHGTTARIAWETAEGSLSAFARPLARALRRRTRRLIHHREEVSSTYTYGYGLFRRYFLEMGRRLVERGAIEAPDDVMYLYLDELRAAIGGEADGTWPSDLIAARKAEMDQLRDIHLPEVIIGDDFVPIPAEATGNTVTGIPTSRGHHRGTLRVVLDTHDFGKVEAGDVIAIPFSDVGWTPLFARAGAVIAEAGGILSHSSIVAREYRIPCVVSVPGATRLPDGATVTVDGYGGTIVVTED